MAPTPPGEKPAFPPVRYARPDGLLAVGGDLSVDRLLEAYRYGIFPWYDTPPVLWWYPDPRFVLFPEKLHVSKSMRQVLKKEVFSFTLNKAFSDVMQHCGQVPRKGQRGTWITRDMIRAYEALHEAGYAVSAEAWKKGKLVGGLYGVRLGKLFFGESMFSLEPNASKAAFIHYTGQLLSEGVELIDCQVYTPHLASLGAEAISAEAFGKWVRSLVREEAG